MAWKFVVLHLWSRREFSFVLVVGDIFLYPTYKELILPAKSSKTWILLKLITDSQLVFFHKYGQYCRTFLLLDQLILWCNYLLVKCEHNFYCTILSFLENHYQLRIHFWYFFFVLHIKCSAASYNQTNIFIIE